MLMFYFISKSASMVHVHKFHLSPYGVLHDINIIFSVFSWHLISLFAQSCAH